MITSQKPIAVFDLETTGLDISNDRIVEIAIFKIHPDGTEEKYEKRINPEMKISEESVEIHGISNEMLKDAPTFRDIAKEVAGFIGDAHLVGYNSNKFDIPILAEEFLRVDYDFDVASRKFIDVQNIFHKMEQRTLVAAYKFYCGKDLINAHSAMADVTATYEILKEQVVKYKEDLENNVDFLADFSKNNKHELLDFAGRIAINKNGDPIYNFGKHKGKTIAQVADEEPGYYGWMLNSNFPLYTKEVLKKEMEKIKANQAIEKEKRKEREQQKIENKLEELQNKFKK
jgi:DNA polymerase-3 subunit epsilon